MNNSLKNDSSIPQFESGTMYFLPKVRSGTMTIMDNPLAVPAASVSDGTWHNVTVSVLGQAVDSDYFLDIDGRSAGPRKFGIGMEFDSDQLREMNISGRAVVDGRQIEG